MEHIKIVQHKQRNIKYIFYPGIYSTPDPAIAEEYATIFKFEGKKYKVLIQNRVNMEDTDVVPVKHVTHTGDYYVTANKENIRPYGLLFKMM